MLAPEYPSWLKVQKAKFWKSEPWDDGTKHMQRLEHPNRIMWRGCWILNLLKHLKLLVAVKRFERCSKFSNVVTCGNVVHNSILWNFCSIIAEGPPDFPNTRSFVYILIVATSLTNSQIDQLLKSWEYCPRLHNDRRLHSGITSRNKTGNWRERWRNYDSQKKHNLSMLIYEIQEIYNIAGFSDSELSIFLLPQTLTHENISVAHLKILRGWVSGFPECCNHI